MKQEAQITVSQVISSLDNERKYVPWVWAGWALFITEFVITSQVCVIAFINGTTLSANQIARLLPPRQAPANVTRSPVILGNEKDIKNKTEILWTAFFNNRNIQKASSSK